MRTIIKFKIITKANTPEKLDKAIQDFNEIMDKTNAKHLLNVERSDPYYTGLLSIEWHCSCPYFQLEPFIEFFGIVEAENNKLKDGGFSIYTLVIDGSLH